MDGIGWMGHSPILVSHKVKAMQGECPYYGYATPTAREGVVSETVGNYKWPIHPMVFPVS
jgi:hypothetical protein